MPLAGAARRHVLHATAMVLFATTGAAAHSQVSTWTIDPVHSGVEFAIRHAAVSTVRGSISKVNGTIRLDEKDITHSSVDATMAADTVNTNDAQRDAHLKSPDFFDAAKYPLLKFHSTSLTRVDGKLRMTGDLTLGGQTRPVTLDVDGPAPPQKGMGGKIISGFSASGTLKRSDFNFGQKYSNPAILGDDVKFTIDIEMDKQ